MGLQRYVSYRRPKVSGLVWLKRPILWPGSCGNGRLWNDLWFLFEDPFVFTIGWWYTFWGRVIHIKEDMSYSDEGAVFTRHVLGFRPITSTHLCGYCPCLPHMGVGCPTGGLNLNTNAKMKLKKRNIIYIYISLSLSPPLSLSLPPSPPLSLSRSFFFHKITDIFARSKRRAVKSIANECSAQALHPCANFRFCGVWLLFFFVPNARVCTILHCC